jgi:hypothetical protein
MHSDDSLMMAFGEPDEAFLIGAVRRMTTAFPYGLYTPAGIMVANPVFANAALRKKFDSNKYHGMVSWGMQEDLMIIGLNRQLKRADLSPSTLSQLKQAREVIIAVIQAKESLGGGEVFSLKFDNGQWTAVPFAGDAKSNSNQLWSHLRILP